MDCYLTETGRKIKNRHRDGCGSPTPEPGETGSPCPGCEPCTEAHCRTCNRVHARVTCEACLDLARSHLRAITGLAPRLPYEARLRGIDHEAFNLIGPTADPEAWHHRALSVMAGRLDPGSFDPYIDQRHPRWVLTYWAHVAREALGQPSDLPPTMARCAAYLDSQLHVIAATPVIPFKILARDLRQTKTHLEAVLYDGDPPETTRVPCLTCGVRLNKHYATPQQGGEAADWYECPYCHDTYDHGRYERAKHDNLASRGADRFVPVTDAIAATGRPEQTVRAWIRQGRVTTRRDPYTNRLLAWWPDVRRLHTEAATRRSVS